MHYGGEAVNVANFVDVSRGLVGSTQLKGLLDTAYDADESKRLLRHRLSQWRARRDDHARHTRLLKQYIETTALRIENDWSEILSHSYCGLKLFIYCFTVPTPQMQYKVLS